MPDSYISEFLSLLGEKALFDNNLLSHYEREWNGLTMSDGSEGKCKSINGLNLESDIRTLVTNKLIPEISKLHNDITHLPKDIYLFHGLYDETPLGVHKDDDETYLFHLGPGSKKCYLYGFLYEDGDSHILEITLTPGMLIYIPSGVYHRFSNPEVSTTLGITVFPTNMLSRLSELVTRFKNIPDCFTCVDITYLMKLYQIMFDTNYGYLHYHVTYPSSDVSFTGKSVEIIDSSRFFIDYQSGCLVVIISGDINIIPSDIRSYNELTSILYASHFIDKINNGKFKEIIEMLVINKIAKLS